MKLIKIIIVSISVLVLVVFAAVLILINVVDVNKFKPQIVSQASDALKRPVNIGRISLGFSLARGIRLNLNNFTVGDNALFQKGELLSVKNLSAGIHILPLLTGKIQISNVLLQSPIITIIRLKDGSVNAQTVGVAIPDGVTQLPKLAAADIAGSRKPQAALPAFSVDSLGIEDGVVVYTDRSLEPPINLVINKLAFHSRNLTLSKPFDFNFSASLLSDKPDINAKGSMAIDASAGNIKLSRVQVTINLEGFSAKRVRDTLPMLKDVPLPEDAKGMLVIELENMKMGAKGLAALKATGKIKDISFKLKGLAVPVQALNGDFSVSDILFDLSGFACELANGKIEGKARIEDYQKAQAFFAESSFQKLSLEKMLEQEKAPVKAAGMLEGNFKASGKGFTPESLKNISANGKIKLTDGKLKDLNILRTVLDKISMIPGLSEKLYSSLPERYQKRLQQKDTELKDTALDLTVNDGQVIADPLEISSEEFIFKGRAAAGFDQSMSVSGDLKIPQELSGLMIDSVSQLQYLKDETGMIAIPVAVSGKLNNPKFTVDLEYIGKKLFYSQGANQLQKLLDKALGKDDKADSAQGNEQSGAGEQPQQPSQENSGVKDAVKGVLDQLLKK